MAIYVAVVDPCLEYNLHKNITRTHHYTQYTRFSMLFTSHVAVPCIQLFHTHHTGDIVLVVYLSIHLFIPQSVYLSICSSLSLSIYPSVHPSVYLSIHLFIPQSVCLSICSSLSLSVYSSVHPPVCLSIHLFIPQSVCLSMCLSVIQIKPSFCRQKYQSLPGFPNITSQTASCYSHNSSLIVWFHFNNKVHAGVQYSTLLQVPVVLLR